MCVRPGGGEGVGGDGAEWVVVAVGRKRRRREKILSGHVPPAAGSDIDGGCPMYLLAE